MREKILDIYFLKEYGKLCQAMGEGRCNIFEWKSESGMIKNMFIMRPVPWLIHGVQYYDIVTPYGYGGPMIFETNNGEKLSFAIHIPFLKVEMSMIWNQSGIVSC